MRLLVVDDHEVVRRGVRSLLSEHDGWEICGEAIDGQEALEKARELKPDLIVMDVSMPRLNGLEATRQILNVLPNCEVLVLSQHENAEMARQALKAGARGYVVKSSISRDLLSAVDKASRREYFFDPAILQQNSTSNTDVQEILQRSAAFEKALRVSEERLQKLAAYQSAVMHNMAEGLYAVDENGLVTSINPAAQTILGWNADELIGKKMHDVIHYKRPDGSPFPASECPALRVRETGIPLREHQDTFIHKDGSSVPVVFTASPLKTDGRICGVIVSFRDDTEHRRARESLNDSKEQLILALQSSKSAMFDWDVIHQRGQWNLQMAAIYEFHPKNEYITSEEWITLFHPEDVERLTLEAQQFWKQGDEFYFDFRTAPRDGKVKWISSQGRVIRDAGGKAVRMIGTHTDVTERKQFEISLAASARQQKALFHLADELHRSRSMDDVYNAAMNAILDALQCNRTSILLCDDAGVMRFRGWRGLSSEYRSATDGHSAWQPGEQNPQPVCIEDINTADLPGSLKTVVKNEGISSMAFIPLVANGQLTGKFMAYFNTPHRFTPDEIELSLTLARQLSFAIDRRRNDDVLEESKRVSALLAAIVTSSDDAIVSKNLSGVIQSWNAGAERIFGFTAKEAVGEHIKLIIPSDRHAEEDHILARLRQGERIDHFQTIRRRKDGTLIDVSLTISPIRDSSGRVVGASKIARDITAQKQAEEALRESEQNFRSIAETGADAIVRMDAKGFILFANNAAGKLFGHKPDALVGMKLIALMPDYLREIHKCALERYLQTGQRHLDWARTEVTALHKTGREISVELSLSESIVRGRSVFTGFLRDITERKRAENDLRQSEERFRKLSESLDAEVHARTAALEEQTSQVRELSWMLMRAQDEERRHIARELHDSAGQTLAAISMTLGAAIHETPKLAAPAAKRFEEVQSMVQQLTSEIRTTSYLLHPPLLDESGLSSALNWYIQGLSERSNIAMVLEMSENFGRLPSDMELVIFRLVQECLTNIHRHSGSQTASIRLRREAGKVCLEVSDQGKGIAPARLDEIQSGGSGVGIRGMRERLRRFGGSMSIQSSSSGTQIIASIPIPKDIGSTDLRADSDSASINPA